jgi:transposase
MADILENAEADLTPLMRDFIDTRWDEGKLVEEQIEQLNDDPERVSASDPRCTRIRQIPGIVPLVATAIVAWFWNMEGDSPSVGSFRKLEIRYSVLFSLY